jgi:hypothetical protein
VTGIAAKFPGVPHRYCANYSLWDLARPILEADGDAKVQMRKEVRGLRRVEQSILNHRRDLAPVESEASPSLSIVSGVADRDDPPPVQVDSAGDVVLDYCAAVRAILNDDRSGPLHPPGFRMAEGVDEVRQSIERNVAAKKGGSRRRS